MNNFLIIFIDSFPFDFLKKTKHLKSFKYKKRLIPGFGFSKNILPELYAGKRPDDLGYFNECGLGTINAEKNNKSLKMEFLRFLHSLTPFDMIIHRGLRTITNRYLNIPFHLNNYFVRHKDMIYERPKNTIFSFIPDIKFVLAEKQEVRPGQRDKRTIDLAKTIIQKSPYLYLSLVDLDWVAHKYGTHSKEYLEHLKFLDASIAKVIELYRNMTSATCKIFVLSDHGMADVKKGMALNIERELGLAGQTSYLYFIDSTMIRFWVFKENYRKHIITYLKNIGVGQIVSYEERKEYGLRLRDAGDILYILNEGFVFAPSFQRVRKDKAMHGYHPKLRSQHGIFLSDKIFDNSQSIKSVDVYKVLSTLLQL